MSLARRSSPSTFTHDTTSTGAWAISAPAGVTAGDILVMKAGAIGSFTWTGPTGWTLAVDEASNSNVHVTIWVKVATGSDSYSITPSIGVKGSATVEAYTGGDVNVPIEAVAHGVATTVGSVVAALTTTVTGDWVSYATVSRHPTAAAKTLTTSDGSDLELLDHGTSAGPTSDVTFGSYDSNRALTAGAQSRTITVNTGTEQQFAWAMVAIRPAGAPSGALVNIELDAPTALPPLRGALIAMSLTAPAPSAGKSGGIIALSLTAPQPAGSSGPSGVYSLAGGAWSPVGIHTLVNGEW
jgi:hypothetical protein